MTGSRLIVLFAYVWVSLFPVAATAEPQRILVIGDSLLATHGLTGQSVAAHLERQLGQRVTDRSTIAARIIYKLPVTGALGLSIPDQFRGKRWDWVVVNGGGNDLWMGCGCGDCGRKLDQLISRSGTKGAIPGLLYRIHQTGARIVYVGYLRSPGIGTPIEGCKASGDALETRIATLAAKVPTLHFLSLADLVPPGDLTYFALDRIHPSPKASRAIAARIAAVIAGGS